MHVTANDINYSTIGMLEDNFVLLCYPFLFDGSNINAIYSFHYNNLILFGYNNYLYIYIYIYSISFIIKPYMGI